MPCCAQIRTCWDLVKHHAGFEERKAAVALYNSKSRYRKRGLAYVPTKFGIAFTAAFLNQVSPAAALCPGSCL